MVRRPEETRTAVCRFAVAACEAEYPPCFGICVSSEMITWFASEGNWFSATLAVVQAQNEPAAINNFLTMRIKSGERRTQVRWLASIYEQVAAHKLKK